MTHLPESADSSAASSLCLRAAPDPARLQRVRQRIRDYLRYRGATADDEDDVVLAIDEACANAICHGRCDDELEISLAFEGDKLEVKVRDRGVGFDGDGVDRQQQPDPSSTGGRGLFLMEQLMDELQISVHHGTEVLMRKRLSLLSPKRRRARPASDDRLTPSLESQLSSTLDDLSDGFAAIDWEWRFIYVNPAGLDLMGVTGASLLGTTVWAFLGEHAPDEIETGLRCTMEQGEPARFDAHFSDQERWAELRVHPSAFGVSVYFTDVTERRRVEQEAERRSRAVLQSLLSFSPVIHAAGTVREVVDEICGRGRETFECDSVSFYAVSRDSLKLLARMPESAAAPVGSIYRIAEVPGLEVDLLRQGPSYVRDALTATATEQRRVLLRDLGLASTLRLPVAVGSRPVGLIVLGWGEQRPSPGEETLAVAKRFADQAGLAWENAERREAQAEMARLHDRLEASLLPRMPFHHPSLQVSAVYKPGEGRLRLGGDFFDVLPCNQGQLAVLVGDVCGHGPDAAALGATMRGNWRALNLSGAGLQTLVNTLETVLVLERWAPDVFVTMVGGWIDPDGRRFRFVNAGHPPPLLIGPGGVREIESRPELPLGIRDGPQPWRAHEIDLPPGWALLFYTDGLVEGRAAARSPERFGLARLLDLVAQRASRGDLDALPQLLLDEAERAHGDRLPDDAAALLVRARA